MTIPVPGRLGVLALAITAATARADEIAALDPQPVALSLSAAAADAVGLHPALRAARARADASARDVGEARAEWLPTLSLNGSAVKYEEPMVVTPIHGFDPGNIPEFDDVLLQGSLTADWLLFDGGGREARIGRRRALSVAAREDAAAGEARLVGRTITAYLRVLGLAATRDAHDRRLEALAAEEARVAQLAEVGRAPDVDLRRAEAARAAAEAERVRLVAALDVVERELARLTGHDVSATRAGQLRAVSLADTAQPARPDLVARALAASPAVRAAEARAEAAADGVRAGRAARWPSLRAVGNVQAYGSDEEEPVAEWNAGVRVSVPLWTGGAISSRVGSALAAREAAESDLAVARLDVEGALDEALAAANEARARTGSLERAVAKFEEVARIEKLRLDAESGTQTDWLDAESELLVARAQLVDARHAEIVARAEIARLTGTLDVAWIDHTLEAE